MQNNFGKKKGNVFAVSHEKNLKPSKKRRGKIHKVVFSNGGDPNLAERKR